MVTIPNCSVVAPHKNNRIIKGINGLELCFLFEKIGYAIDIRKNGKI